MKIRDRRKGALVRAALTLLTAALLLGAPVDAQPAPEFYKGRTLTLIVSVPPGGGYDVLARAVGRHIGRNVPGGPNVVVQNMPGAGGVVATNYLANIAAKDGTVIALVSNNTPFEPLFGNKEARYDPAKINWIGSPGSEIGIWGVWHASPVQRWQDARGREVTSAITGITSGHNLYTRVLAETLGLKLKAIAGYPGQNEIYLAMERGEVDGNCGWSWTSAVASRPQWFKDGTAINVMQFASQRHPDLKDVPLLSEFARNDNERAQMELVTSRQVMGRPFFAPPAVPADRVAALRKAFMDTLKDPDFMAQANKAKMEINPVSGEQVQALVQKLLKTPPDVVAATRKNVGG